MKASNCWRVAALTLLLLGMTSLGAAEAGNFHEDTFFSGAFDDDNPVTWETTGSTASITSSNYVEDGYAVEMNPDGTFYYDADNNDVIEEGDTFTFWNYVESGRDGHYTGITDGSSLDVTGADNSIYWYTNEDDCDASTQIAFRVEVDGENFGRWFDDDDAGLDRVCSGWEKFEFEIIDGGDAVEGRYYGSDASSVQVSDTHDISGMTDFNLDVASVNTLEVEDNPALFDVVSYPAFNEPPEFESVESDPEPPQIGENVSYYADVFDPDDDSELEEVELQLTYGGETVFQETRSVSGDSDSASWSDAYVPEQTNEWLNATFTAEDTEGDSTTEELDYFLDDTPPEINIVQPENQTYWSYDIPYEIEVDSNNDAVPDQDFELEIYSDGELVEELSGSGTETFSGEFRQDLGDDLEFEAVANDTGGETSETTTYSVDFFEFTDFSSSNNVYETESEQFASTQEVGEMVEEITYRLVWDSSTEETLSETYHEYETVNEALNLDIPLVDNDGESVEWYIGAEIDYLDVDGESVNESVQGGSQAQDVHHAFTLADQSLEDGTTQLEGSDLEYTANLSQEFEGARGELSGEAEFGQTEESVLLDEENVNNESRLFTGLFESELVDSSSESFDFELDVEFEFEGSSRTISSSDVSVTLDRFELDDSGDEEVLRFDTWDEETDDSLDTDLEVNFEVYNPDNSDLTREYDLEFSDSDSHSVYLTPEYGEVVVDVFGDNYVEFDASGEDSELYDRRRHYLMGETLTSDTTVVDLFLLEQDSASRVELLVEDSELNPISGQVVRVERSFDGGSRQQTVVMGQSGSTGTDSVFIDEDEQYVFTVFNDEGQRVERFGPQSIPRDLEVELQVDEDPITRFDEYIRGVEFEVTVLEDEVIVEYDTDREELNKIELKVLEDGMFDDVEVGSDTSTATSGQLRVDGFNASSTQLQYRLNGYFDGEEFITSDRKLLLDSGRFGEGVSEFQEGGLFITLMLFMVLTFSGLYRPEAAIGMGVVALIVSSFVGFLAIGQTALIAVISIGAILIWRMI